MYSVRDVIVYFVIIYVLGMSAYYLERMHNFMRDMLDDIEDVFKHKF